MSIFSIILQLNSIMQHIEITYTRDSPIEINIFSLKMRIHIKIIRIFSSGVVLVKFATLQCTVYDTSGSCSCNPLGLGTRSILSKHIYLRSWAKWRHRALLPQNYGIPGTFLLFSFSLFRFHYDWTSEK